MSVRRVGPLEHGRPCADAGARERGEKRHPIDRVVVTTYRGNYSAFSGYHFTPSDYSALRCEACGAVWRTNAAYVEELPIRPY